MNQTNWEQPLAKPRPVPARELIEAKIAVLLMRADDLKRLAGALPMDLSYQANRALCDVLKRME